MPSRSRFGLPLLAASLLSLFVVIAPLWAQVGPQNIALHRPYTADPAPNYALCADEADATQLTDGVYTGLPFWTQKPTVGWSSAKPVSITVDLGQDEPIAGVAYSTAAGAGGVEWPWSIVILTSTDGQTWRRAGDVARLDRQSPAKELTAHRFATEGLRTHGRYVRFLVGTLAYTFADEIEVFRGQDAWLQEAPAGRDVTDMTEAGLEAQGVNAMLERLRGDLAEGRQAIVGSRLDAVVKDALSARATALADEIEGLPNELPEGFRTIMPFSDLQARIFALHAPVRRAAGYPGLVAWATGRWDPLLPTQAPAEPPVGVPDLQVAMMRGEHRAAALNLTNSTDQPLRVTISTEGLPGGANPDYVSVREVLFTDTYVRQPIAAALPEAPREAGGYVVGIPAGMTRQVWLAFHPTNTVPGEYRGRVVVAAPDMAPLEVPVSLHVSPVQLPAAQSVAVGGWDYTDQPVSPYDGGVVSQPAFIAKMREYGVNTPWATGCGEGAEFDDEGTMVRPPDFAGFDAWVAKWPGAKYYATFGLSKDLNGVAPGSPIGKRRVAHWLMALTEHMKEIGLRPDQLLVLLVDEPLNPEQVSDFIAFAEAVREANTGIRIWEDPCHDDPATADPRLYELSDILSPSGARFIGSPQSYRDFFEAETQKGRELWFYNCVNGKHLDPITYHRGTFWLAIRYGAKGCCFWAFGDEGRSGSSFRAYTSPGHMFSPLFLDPQLGIIDGKHMEAIREGAEDFELFAMLRARVAELDQKGVKGDAVDEARRVLTDGPERVTRDLTIERLGWTAPKDREVMDEVRLEALAALEKLAGL